MLTAHRSRAGQKCLAFFFEFQNPIQNSVAFSRIFTTKRDLDPLENAFLARDLGAEVEVLNKEEGERENAARVRRPRHGTPRAPDYHAERTHHGRPQEPSENARHGPSAPRRASACTTAAARRHAPELKPYGTKKTPEGARVYPMRSKR